MKLSACSFKFLVNFQTAFIDFNFVFCIYRNIIQNQLNIFGIQREIISIENISNI